jgi:hypothetical protein
VLESSINPADQRLTCSFPCAACGKTTAVVEFLPPGVLDPGPFAAGAPAGLDGFMIESARVAIRGGPFPFSTGATPNVAAAVRDSDVTALYAIDQELANFWCPSCRAAYCHDHWVVEVPYDGPFFDDAIGRCPANHERRLVE